MSEQLIRIIAKTRGPVEEKTRELLDRIVAYARIYHEVGGKP